MKIIYFLLIIITISCSNKSSQKIEKNDILVDNQSESIVLDRENILNQLRQPGEKYLNINNAFQITLPESFNIVDINQNLIIDRETNSNYLINNRLGLVYKNKFFFFNIACIGNTNTSILNGDETFGLRCVTSPFGNQLNYLKKNYSDIPIINDNNVKYSRFISHWGTGWSSDYYGLYLETEDNDFNKYQISIHNILGKFSNSDLSELNSNNKRIKNVTDEDDLEEVIQDLELMENSITLSISDNSINILNGNIGEGNEYLPCIFPTVNNLNMRRTPSLTGEIIGTMEVQLYYVIMTGEEEVIDNIKGNWIMVMPFNSFDVSWVFNGYTRSAEDDEIDRYMRT